jgi:hypothetical protein
MDGRDPDDGDVALHPPAPALAEPAVFVCGLDVGRVVALNGFVARPHIVRLLFDQGMVVNAPNDVRGRTLL